MAFIALLLVLGAATCGAAGAEGDLVERARLFRSLVEQRDFDSARAMMTEDPRRWWERREGDGMPWRVGPGKAGPWAEWDDHFRSQKETVGWRAEDGAATVVVREWNDYFRLLERDPVRNEITYFFDDEGKIEGLLIRAAGDRDPGLTEEFVAWARANAPEELEILMPDGEIDPSDPARFRALLERWRAATGREPIPAEQGAGAADTRNAIEAMVERYGGTIEVDRDLPGAPIVAIDLHHTEVTDADLALLAGLESLRELDLRLTGISDAGVRHLASLTQLEKLNLFRTTLTDEGLAHLTRLTRLHTLLIGGTRVTDAGLAHLRAFTELRKLSVFDTAVGDGGVETLVALPSLEVLLIGRSRITEDGAAEIQRRNPRISFREM